MSGFDETPLQSWKLNERATSPEEDAEHLAEAIETFVTSYARVDSHKTDEERTEDMALKAFKFGLTVPELEALIEAKKAERAGRLGNSEIAEG